MKSLQKNLFQNLDCIKMKINCIFDRITDLFSEKYKIPMQIFYVSNSEKTKLLVFVSEFGDRLAPDWYVQYKNGKFLALDIEFIENFEKEI